MRLFWSTVAMIHGEIGSGYRFCSIAIAHGGTVGRNDTISD